MKTILITGCSSGIGYDAATTLHKQGWQVLATCRKEADCKRLEESGLTSFVLDYASPESVSEGAKKALSLGKGRVDALFNNGAYAVPGCVEDIPRQALREIFEVNLFGQFELINYLLPSMREHNNGYIINNSSVLGFAGMTFRGAYCATKFAMEGMTDAMRIELADTEIKVVLIEPGPITTKIRANSIAPFERWIDVEGSAQRKRYDEQLKPRLYDDSGEPDRFELPPSAVTDKLIKILGSSNPRPRYYVTVPTYLSGYAKRIMSSRMFDRFLSIG